MINRASVLPRTITGDEPRVQRAFGNRLLSEDERLENTLDPVSHAAEQ